jgi:hypothetical protein
VLLTPKQIQEGWKKVLKCPHHLVFYYTVYVGHPIGDVENWACFACDKRDEAVSNCHRPTFGPFGTQGLLGRNDRIRVIIQCSSLFSGGTHPVPLLYPNVDSLLKKLRSKFENAKNREDRVEVFFRNKMSKERIILQSPGVTVERIEDLIAKIRKILEG